MVICSTDAPHYVVRSADVAAALPQRNGRPLFFIDIAVPRDVEEKVHDLSNVYLYDIDDLNSVVEMNRAERDKEAVKATRIVEEETLKFSGWLENIEVTPTIIALRTMAEDICRAELERTMGRLDSLSAREKKSLEKMTRAICSKMLHHPMQYLKTTHPCVDRQQRVEVVRELFALNRKENN